MTILIADHLQITRFWVSGVIRDLNSKAIIRETDDREKCCAGTSRHMADMLVTSASFLMPENKSFRDPSGFLMKFPLKILIRDRKIPEEIVSLFNEVIEPDEDEKSIITKLNTQINAVAKDGARKHGNEDISLREKEVLRLVALGLTNKEIAGKLFISSHTVITHRKNITAKLGIRTIAGLTLYAVINKLITPEDIQER